MKSFWMILACFGLLVSTVSAQDSAKKETKTKVSAKEQAILKTVSYGLGRNFATQLKSSDLDLDTKAISQGIEDALADKKSRYTEAELNAAFKQLNRLISDKRDLAAIEANPKLKATSEKNRKEGEAFLAANKKKKGVVTLESGLQYQVIKQGKGDIPKESDKVVTHYHGTLINGEVFDSSVDRKEPSSFGVTQVIAGWTEALQLMQVGSKWKLFVPSDLAYRYSSRSEKISPNTTLIFEIELLSIK